MLCHDVSGYISNNNTLKSIYYAHFHSIVQYRIIFWGNSSNNGKIFTLQKKIDTIMAVAHPRTSLEFYLNN
jgi:hypothetical protein